MTGEQPGAILTFLIADVRGYTRFTQEHGDEAAARLATKFADVTRATVASSGGRVIELRGDEALAVFDSARQAIRAAVELQGHFADQTVADPTLPLAVGIGWTQVRPSAWTAVTAVGRSISPHVSAVSPIPGRCS